MASFSWTDTEEIAFSLLEAYPDRNPMRVRFTELRDMVERLPGFEASGFRGPNEQILEAIQAAWCEEAAESGGGGSSRGDAGSDSQEDEGYRPHDPFR